MYKTLLPRKCVSSSVFAVCGLQPCARWLHKNHYDVLNVKVDCTEKEIRDSFIRLSKEHHPDTSKGKSSPATFQSIMEAYRVLSKPDTRRNYDVDMRVRPIYPKSGYATATDFPDMQNQQYQSKSNSYYGIDGVQKWSNGRIMLAILCFAGLGVAIQAVAIKLSFLFKRDQLNQASMRAHRAHTELRAEVEKCDREAQLERVLRNLKKTEL